MPTAPRSGDDATFQRTTAAFAAVVLLIVIGIGFELTRQSLLSIEKFGLQLLDARAHGIRSPENSARCRSSGARSTRRSWRCSSPRRSRSASRSSSPSSSPGLAAAAADVPDGTARGDSLDRLRPVGRSSCWCPLVRKLETAISGTRLAAAADLQRRAATASGCSPPALILAIMVIPFYFVGGARSSEGGAPGPARGGLRAGRDAVGDDPRRAPASAEPASSAPIMLGFGRALGETMAVTMVIGNNPQISAVALRPAVHDGRRDRQRVHRGRRRALPARPDRDRARVCSSITLVVNACSRLLIWSMSRESNEPPGACARGESGRRPRHDATPAPAECVHSSRWSPTWSVRGRGAARAAPAGLHPVLRPRAEASRRIECGTSSRKLPKPVGRARRAAWPTRSSARSS